METNKTEARVFHKENQVGYNQLQSELANLKGRIDALKIYLITESYPKREVILGMLGVEVDG